MPKKVDHEERRQQIAHALWRIASTRGLDDVSLRDVAAEADISLGRLQHYFRTKDDMLLFALRHINALADTRIRTSIEELAATGGHPPTPQDILRACLTGMLPIDDKSRTGALVSAAYFARAIHDPRMRTDAQEGIPRLAAFFADQIRTAQQRHAIDTTRDPEAEAMLLISLADGLTAYTLLDVHTPERALELMNQHLDRLFTPATAT
ncbi:TetR/AcrR family transcriptional regulator [Streptomyces sp. NPDC001941]|uniref:TetR/AcrR family transcriptional regulator n=1 Tax=Streptomyces sp. NPDC001941 TaxID=3154659 RepID=UPI00332613C8